MRLYPLDQTVLRVYNNAARFLNGLTSNKLEAPYNAFLTVHGRIVTTFYQEKISEEEFLIAVPTIALEKTLQHLERYAKLNGTKLTDSGLKAYMDVDTGKTLIQEAHVAAQASPEEFTWSRLQHFMPLLGVDYQIDEFILNIDEHTFVSYTKGCFLGQEPVAKVHNRSKPTRQLKVKFEEECLTEDIPKITSKALDPKTGKLKGFIFVKNT